MSRDSIGNKSGMVFFVGAGPGDPELITVKGQKLIAQAGLIIYAGSLVPEELLRYAPEHTERYNSAEMKLEQQVSLMAEAVKAGRTVIRLHTGDPSIYGAITEQMRALDELGIPYRVIPGVSSAMAAAAALQVELTIPESTQTIVLTRLSGRTLVPERERLAGLAAHRTSLIIFLSTGMIERVVEELLFAGYEHTTPIAVVYRVSWPDEKILRGTLADIGQKLTDSEITHHALIVVSPAIKQGTTDRGQRSHLYGSALNPTKRDERIAIITLTRNSVETGKRLMKSLPDGVLYAPERFIRDEEDEERIQPTVTSVRQTLQSAFRQHRALVCFMASGIVVRDIAPLLHAKHIDPAVVVIDEAGKFAFSLLSGHRGGANALAKQCAQILGGQAVITTASDTLGLPSLDLLADQYGWRLQPAPFFTEISAAMVNGDTIAVYQDCGNPGWLDGCDGDQFTRYKNLEELADSGIQYGVWVTYRDTKEWIERSGQKALVLNPACLCVGIGCNRGTPADEIMQAVKDTFSCFRLSINSISTIATIDIKKDEKGILEVCCQEGWALRTFTADELSLVPELPTPSAQAKKCIGVAGVAEPAALLAAGAKNWLVEKQKYPNVTVAVAVEEVDFWV